jgi:hypothetical protein
MYINRDKEDRACACKSQEGGLLDGRMDGVYVLEDV